ncbi:hypothetical protein [Moraxella catarrhalis]|uniref:hypothetical protein n=1 Tax=Moraxella catarrhalis TaxID=480 RepID=UPI000EAA30E7|nr:hypothetical protein [Moraxella catarrhalis]RKL74615.1 hypothetical protein D6D91_07640 [Moraxella catarrhalis]
MSSQEKHDDIKIGSKWSRQPDYPVVTVFCVEDGKVYFFGNGTNLTYRIDIQDFRDSFKKITPKISKYDRFSVLFVSLFAILMVVTLSIYLLFALSHYVGDDGKIILMAIFFFVFVFSAIEVFRNDS